MTKNSNGRPVALTLTVLGALARLIPHPPNFAPVGAVSLFAGARLPAWQAYLIPIALMAITDPILGAFYGVAAFGKAQIFSYGSFLIAVWLGRRLRSTEKVLPIAAVAFASSVQFFLLSNFPSWLWSGRFEHTAAGLAACYASAIPFFGYTLASDALYTAALFGLYAWLSRRTATQEHVAVA